MVPTEIYSYGPVWALDQLDAHEARTDGLRALEREAATLFVDISGFSTLTSELSAAAGERGTEVVNRVVSACFGVLVNCVHEAGGHIAGFAGDALLAYWPSEAETRARAARSAGHCALRMIDEISAFDSTLDRPIRIRAAVHHGPLVLALVGGVDDRWAMTFGGSAVTELGLPIKRIEPMQAAATPDVLALLGAHAESSPRPEGGHQLRAVVPPPELPARDVDLTLGRVAALVRRCLPRYVVSRLRAGQGEWLASYRWLSFMFIKLEGVEPGLAGLDRVHDATRLIQAALRRHLGVLTEVAVDDKGTYALCMFGLRAGAREYRTSDALVCALELVEDLERTGQRSSVGVATGRVFVGPVGPPQRRAFTAIGPAINLAARLMSMADGRVLCDDATHAGATEELTLDDAGQERLKGFAGLTQLWRPRALAAPERSDSQLVARARERVQLERALGQLAQGESSTFAFEGPSGIGKSALMTAVASRARARGLPVLELRGDAISGDRRPLSAWRWALAPCLDASRGGAGEPAPSAARLDRPQPVVVDTLAERLRSSAATTRMGTSQIEELLGLNLSADGRPVQLRVAGRLAELRAELVSVLGALAESHGLVIVADDLQWFDSSSLGLLMALYAELPRRLLLIGHRGVSGLDKEAQLIPAGEDTVTIELTPFTRDELDALLHARLGVEVIPESVLGWVFDRSRGNPSFAEELLRALRLGGQLQLEDGRLVRLPSLAELDALSIPRTIEGAARYTIDSLDPRLALIVHESAIFSDTFTLSALAALIPPGRTSSPEVLAAHADRLIALGVWTEPADEPGRLRFATPLSRDVAYAALTHARRTELHALAADFFEREVVEGRNVDPGALARHWGQTNAFERALPYLEHAWRRADMVSAEVEALRISTRASALAERVHAEGLAPIPTRERARWHARVASANIGLGHMALGAERASVGLKLLGEDVPLDERAWKSRALGILVRHLLRHALPDWLWPGRASRDAGERADVLERAWGYDCLAEALAFSAERRMAYLSSSLKAIDLALSAGDLTPASSSYGSLSFIANLFGARRRSRRYLERAKRGATASGDPRRHAIVDYFHMVDRVTVGDWSTVDEITEGLLPRVRANRSSSYRSGLLTCMVFNEIIRGHLDRAERYNLELLETGRYQRVDLSIGWAAFNRAAISNARGEFADAERSARQAMELITEGETTRINADSELLLSLLGQGRWGEAEPVCERVVAMIGGTRLINFTRLAAFAAPAEMRILQLERSGARGAKSPEALAARAALDVYRQYAKRHPLGEPRELLLTGRFEAAIGRESRASRTLNRALELARSRGTRVTEARTLLALGELDPAGPARGQGEALLREIGYLQWLELRALRA